MIEKLRPRWKETSERERAIVLVGGVVVGLSLLFVLVLDPLLAKLDRLERQAVRKEKDIQDLTRLSQQYVAKMGRLAEVHRHMPGPDNQFSLLTFMETAVKVADAGEWLTEMYPQVQSLPEGYQETAVSVQLIGVHLPELLALLVAIEEAPYRVTVRYLQIRPKFDAPEYLDVNLRVYSYAKGS